MTKKPDSRDDEQSLFRQFVDKVRPLAQTKISPYRQKRPARPVQRHADEQQVMRDMMSDPLELSELETGEELLFARSGVQPNMLRKLRRGQYCIEAELDLHRMTSAEARQAIACFLPQMSQAGKRCVRVIHGKGHGSFNKLPVLKSKLNHWLQQRDDVLAFCSARPVDGGTGAIYVLLKKPAR